MSAISLKNAIIVVHPLLIPISDDEIEHAFEPATIGPSTQIVRIGNPTLQFDKLEALHWDAERESLTREIEAKLSPVINDRAGPIFYFGMAPIPLAIKLGSKIGPARRLLTYQQRHDTKLWRWPTDHQTVRGEILGVPSAKCKETGDVIICVSCSHLANVDDARQVVPSARGEFHVVIENTHEDALQSETDVTFVATKFGEALDLASNLYPNCDVIHVFAAVPPALAVRMGAQINPTIHKSIQTYQFSARSRPRYIPALLIGEARPKLPNLTVSKSALSAQEPGSRSPKWLSAFQEEGCQLTGNNMSQFIDHLPFDWSRRESQELLKVLSTAYDDIGLLRILVSSVPLDSTSVNWNQAAIKVWIDVINDASKAGRLRKLIDKALEDGSVAGFHPRLRELLKNPPADQTDGEKRHGVPIVPAIKPDFSRRLREAFLRCSQFESDQQLRVVFTLTKLRPWKDSLPSAMSPSERVLSTIAFLDGKRRSDTGEYATVLLLRALSDLIDPADELHSILLALADEFKAPI